MSWQYLLNPLMFLGLQYSVQHFLCNLRNRNCYPRIVDLIGVLPFLLRPWVGD